MKTNTILIVFLLSNFLHAQTLLKENFKQQIMTENECALIHYEIIKEGENISKIFEIDVKQDGYYNVYSWIMGNNQAKKLRTDFYLDKISALEFEVSKDNWHFVKIKNQKERAEQFFFKKGKNRISFTTTIPEIPQIDFVVLSKSPSPPSSAVFDNFIDSLKLNTIDNSKIINELVALDDPPFESNPVYDYDYRMNSSYSYTFRTTLYLYAGSQVTLETKKSNPYGSDPVMYLFFGSNPENFSRGNDNGGLGYQSKIQTTVPYSGIYYVVIRSKNPNAGQTSDLWLNNSLYISNIPVSGYYTASSNNSTEQLNYFTSYSTGDPFLWIECYDPAHNKILWFNDNYEGPGGFDWGMNARVKKSFSSSTPVRGILVTSSSSYYPSGSCDLYRGCKNGQYNTSLFPNLNSDDAINSNINTLYNCYAWAGGVTSEDVQPHLSGDGGPYWEPNQLSSFDNYFGNVDLYDNPLPRYNGAINYTRVGANQGNSIIDLWGVDHPNGIQYTHASVRKPGNNHTHGYDWESKNGSDPRIFHPRYALQGTAYGTVKNYFISSGTYSHVTQSGEVLNIIGEGLTMEESIAKGLTVIDTINFNVEEEFFLNSLIIDIPTKIYTEYTNLEKRFKELTKVAWEYDIKEKLDYKNILNYCKENLSETLPLMIKKYYEGESGLIYLINDLVIPANEQLKQNVLESAAKIRLTANGKYIAPSIKAFNIRFFKELMKNDNFKNLLTKKSLVYQSTNQDASYDVSTKIELNNYPNPYNNSTVITFSLPKQTVVSLKIYNILGQEVETLINDEFKDKGMYRINWDGIDKYNKQLSSGIYIYTLKTENQIISKKMQLLK